MGTGHFYRLLALAQEARGRGEDVGLIYRELPLQLEELAGDVGVSLLNLGAERGSREDAEALGRHASEVAASAVVVDGYEFRPDYFQHLVSTSGKFVCVAIDDENPGEYPVDVLVNVNIFASSLSYRVPPSSDLLLGPRYALIRQQFRKCRVRGRRFMSSSDGISRVLVSLGGGDPDNTTVKVLAGLKRANYRGRVDVVIGPANPHIASVRENAEAHLGRAVVHTNVRDMATLMLSQDLVICGAGGTCWEVACLGIPMLQVVVAENQRRNAEGLAEVGCSINLGRSTQLSPADVAQGFFALAETPSLRKDMSRAGRSLVDGRGCLRVLQAIDTSAGHVES